MKNGNAIESINLLGAVFAPILCKLAWCALSEKPSNYSFSDNNMSLKAIHLGLESYARPMKKIQQLANCSLRTAITIQVLNVTNAAAF